MESEDLDFIEIGTIVAAQGLKGQVRVKSDSDFPERFEQPGTRWLQINENSNPQSIDLIGGYQIPGKDVYVVQLKGIENRTQAESLRGGKLLVPSGDRPLLANDEYHVSDLINMEVFNQINGENIGIVVNIFTTGHDLLEVELHQQPTVIEKKEIDLSKITRTSKIKKVKRKKAKKVTVLIPFVKEIVPVVNIKENRIEINPPDGLL